MKCGECENIGSCTHRDKTDDTDGCSMFYPNVYMSTNHKEEWKDYVEKLSD
jgi:hypothetical protein